MKTHKVSKKQKQLITTKDKNTDSHEKDSAKDQVILAILSSFARTQINPNGLNENEISKIQNEMKSAAEIFATSLEATTPLQTMIAIHMLSIHELQQKVFTQAKKSSGYPELQQYYINAITKLSNVFIQQATLIYKLQGHNQQKITVEHVHVHNGGQAIVGNVSGGEGQS